MSLVTIFSAVGLLQLAPVDRAPVVRAPQDPRVAAALSTSDTAGAVRLLEEQLATDRRNAAAWFHFGMLRWQQAQGVRSAGFMRDARDIRHLQLADSALRLAVQLEPSNAEFTAALARFNRQAPTTTQRLAGQQQTERALQLARRTGDSALIAWGEAEQGIDAWRRFTGVRNRAHTTGGQRLQVQTNMRWDRARGRSYVNSMVKRLTPPTGREDFDAALSRFLVAERTAPTSLRYSRLLFMALAEDGRWEELLQHATRRATAFPMDGQARFARGLALQRLSRTAAARAAFDSARATLDEQEDARLFGLQRLLSPESGDAVSLDSARLLALAPAQRMAATRMFWATRDPLTDSTANAAEVEFMARVVEAEFRFTDDALSLNGADTDRGQVLVRYGPPNEILTLDGAAGVGQDVLSRGRDNIGQAMTTNESHGRTIVWLYDTGDAFFFDFRPGFGSAQVPQPDMQYVRDVSRARPMSFANVDGTSEVNGLTAQVARFREHGGGVAVTMAARIEADSLGASRGDSVQYLLRVLNGTGEERARTRHARLSNQTVHAITGAADSPQVALIDARRLTAEGGIAAATRARSALALPPGPTASGASMSDLLLTNAAGNAGSGETRGSWRDAAPRALPGRMAAGERVGLVWELYELGIDSTQAASNRYRVTIAVEPLAGSGLRAFGVRVLDAVGRVVGQSTARDARTVQFERRLPASDRVLEQFTLDGIGVERGRVRIRVTVEDLVQRQTYAREQLLLIEPR